jgi:hypothetical protein
MSEQNETAGETGAPADGGQVTVWDAIRSRRDVRAFDAFLIPLGYPAGRPLTPVQRPDRRPFDEVVHRGQW